MSLAKKKAASGTYKRRTGNAAEAAAAARRRFVEAYLANGGNATSAAIQAGYSPKTAYSKGHQLLKEVETGGLLKQRREQLLERLQLTTERTLRRLVTVMESDLSMFVDAKGKLLPPSEWPAEARGAVQSLKWTRFGPEIKLHEVNQALEKAMKHLGLFKEDNKQKADPITALLEAITAHPNAGLKVKP